MTMAEKIAAVLAGLEYTPNVHFIGEEEHLALAREVGAMEKGMPAHLARKIKSIRIDGVLILPYQIVHPQ